VGRVELGRARAGRAAASGARGDVGSGRFNGDSIWFCGATKGISNTDEIIGIGQAMLEATKVVRCGA
jgi:hypothetical protein